MMALWMALLVVLPAHPPRERPALQLADDVVLSDELKPVLTAIAERYHEKTKRSLEVTSGLRTPERQAAAMYRKLAVGGSLAIYKRQALVQPIQKAYRDGRKKKLKKEAIIQAMSEIIAGQVARGEFISRHLRGRAFDARSHGLTGKQRAAFLAAAREVGGVRVLVESHPPHFHVELLPPPPAEVAKDPTVPKEGPPEGPEGDDGEH